MPPKKRPAEDFDLKRVEARVRKEAEAARSFEEQCQEAKKLVDRLKEMQPLSDIGSPAEMIAHELIKAGSVVKLNEAMQLVRDVGHLGKRAMEEASKALCLSEEERTVLIERVGRLSAIREHLESFNLPTLFLAPKKVHCENDHDAFEYSASEVTYYELSGKTKRFAMRAYCRKCRLSFGPWTTDENRSKKKKSNNSNRCLYYPDKDVDFIEINAKNFITKTMIEHFSCQM